MKSYMKNVWLVFAVALLVGCRQSGPSDALIKAEVEKEIVGVAKAFGSKLSEKEMKSKMPTYTFKRGDTLVSTGDGGIPKGTKLYPVRITIDTETTYESIFYKNVYNEWMVTQRQ